MLHNSNVPLNTCLNDCWLPFHVLFSSTYVFTPSAPAVPLEFSSLHAQYSPDIGVQPTAQQHPCATIAASAYTSACKAAHAHASKANKGTISSLSLLFTAQCATHLNRSSFQKRVATMTIGCALVRGAMRLSSLWIVDHRLRGGDLDTTRCHKVSVAYLYRGLLRAG